MRKLRAVFGVVGVTVLLAAGAAAQGVSGDVDKDGPLSAWTPPLPCEGMFTDVPCGSQFDTWVEQFARDGITSGCAAGKYCPESSVTRRQMAVFVERAMRGASGWPPHTVLVYHHPAAEAGSDVSSGTELLSLVAAIPDSGTEMPSATNPWLVKVGPGTYDLGAGSVTLPPYTALEGAGQDITVIAATGYDGSYKGTVTLGHHDRLSRLTVNNTGGDLLEIAVYLASGATSVALDHVTLTASNPTNSSGAAAALVTAPDTSFSLVDCELTAHGARLNHGVWTHNSTGQRRLERARIRTYGSGTGQYSRGIYCAGTAPMVSDSRVEVEDGDPPTGIYVEEGDGALELRNSVVEVGGSGSAVIAINTNAVLQGSTLSGANGVQTSGTGFSTTINNCSITGTTSWLANGLGYTVTVGASKLVGTTSGSGTTHCFGNYTASAFVASTCP
jgi:hypothetical protein